MGLITQYTIDRNRPYIFLKGQNWHSSSFSVQRGYNLAFSDFSHRKNRSFKTGNETVNKFLYKEVANALREGQKTLPKELKNVKDSFFNLISSDFGNKGSMFTEELLGIDITGNKLAFTRTKANKLKTMASKLKNDSEAFAALQSQLSDMLVQVENLGDLSNKENMEKYGIKSIDEVSQLQNAMAKLRALAKLEGKGVKEGSFYKTNTGNINYTEFVRELREVFTTFHYHLRGSGTELINLGVSNAILLVPKFIKKLYRKINVSTGLKVRFDTPVLETVGSDQYSGRVSKGDTSIVFNYYVGETKGTFKITVSEKSSKIKAESFKAKDMTPRLVKEAAFDTIFSGVDLASKMYFMNEYVHNPEARNAKGTVLLQYLGARASTNILAGIENQGQAFYFRERDELKTMDEFFTQVFNPQNISKQNKYINLQIVKKPTINNAKRKGGEMGAIARSNAIYKQFRESMKFSATFGSRQGF